MKQLEQVIELLSDKHHSPIVPSTINRIGKPHYFYENEPNTLFTGLEFYFDSKEVAPFKPTDYYEKIADKEYGIEKELFYMLFLYQGAQYILDYNRFRSKFYNEINAYISNN